MVKLAVGAVGFGIKAYAKHRKEQAKKKQREKQQQQYQSQSTTRDRGFGGSLFGGRQQLGSGSGVISPELSAALESLVRELRQTEDAITGLTVDRGAGGGKGSSHKKCEVRDRLVERAEGIKERIDDLQTTIHNIRNLDADLSRAQQTSAGPGDDTRARDARVRVRERGFRRGSGRPEDSQGQEDEPRREKGRWGGGGSPGRDRAEDERARPRRFGSDDRGDRPRSEMRLSRGGANDGDGQRSRHHHPGPSIRSAWPERS